MNPLDVGAIALVVLGALYGLWRGAVRQVVGVAAWVASFVVPSFAAGPLAHHLQPSLEVPYPLALAFCALGLAILTNIVTRLVLTWVLRLVVRRSDDPEDEDKAPVPAAVDHAAGAVLGAFAMALVAWVFVSVAALVAEALEHDGRRVAVLDGEVVHLARSYNAIGLVASGKLDEVRRAIALRKSAAAGKAAEARAALERDPRFRAIAGDGKLVQALQNGDAMAVARSPELLSLVSDPVAMERVAIVVHGMTAEAR